MRVTISARTDRGLRRAENQDRFIALQNGVAVFDGLGGPAGGGFASAWAAHRFLCWVRRISALCHGKTDAEISALLQEHLLQTHRALVRYGEKVPRLANMGTTATVMLILNGTGYLAQSGDSRLYLLRGDDVMPADGIDSAGQIRRSFRTLTRRHNRYWAMLAQGTPAELADLLPQMRAAGIDEMHRAVQGITACLGAGHEVDPRIDAGAFVRFQVGDRFLLCSDGLTDMVPRNEIVQILRTLSPDDASDALIRRANELGGHDNTTVIVGHVDA